MVWNRVTMVKDPETGKRVSRPNPESEWQVSERPDLAIVPREIFDAVQARKAERGGVKPQHQHRPKHALSGLLRCGACGGSLTKAGSDRTGRPRVACSRHREARTCPDPHVYYLDTIERALFAGLKAELQHPDVIAEYVAAYHAERKRLAASSGARRASAEKRIAALAREIDRLVDAIAKGLGDPAILGPRAGALNREREALQAELDGMGAPVNVIALHPGVTKRYLAQVAALEAEIGKAKGGEEAAEALRDLIESVTIRRDAREKGGIELEVTGRLNALLGESAFPNTVLKAVVAEDGFEPPTRGL